MSRFVYVLAAMCAALFVCAMAWNNRRHDAAPQSVGDVTKSSATTAPVATSPAVKKKPWPQEDQTPLQAYPFLVNGVAGYPYNRRNLDLSWTGLPDRHVYALGTPYGGRGGGPCKENPRLEMLEIYLVTHEGKWANVTVVGDPLELHDLRREIWPPTGKYKFWAPIILFRKEPRDGKTNSVWDLDVIGRFFTEWDRHATNKVNGYRYEVYER